MKRALKIFALLLALLLLFGASVAAWYLHHKQPQRAGTLTLTQLTAPVSVRYDERGVPHIRADNDMDLYRALGYVQAQDRLFQMELMRQIGRASCRERV